MAQHLPARGPYSARVLTPWLVSLLPVDPRVGFLIVTVVALALTYVVWARIHGWLGVPLFLALYYPTFYSLLNPYLVDPVLLLTLVIVVWALTHERGWLASAAFLIGALNKEVILVALPLLIWYRPRGVWVGALGAILITIGLQLSSNGVATFEYSSARAMLGGSVRAGLPFVPWIVLGWSHAPIADRRACLVILCGVLPLTLAGDTGRMLGLVAPFWIPIALQGVRALRQRPVAEPARNIS
jgi:hypothetical protein